MQRKFENMQKSFQKVRSEIDRQEKMNHPRGNPKGAIEARSEAALGRRAAPSYL